MQRKSLLLAAILVGLLGLCLGCKEEVPDTALDSFISRTEHLEGSALSDSLRILARGGAPDNAYANYLLGNGFYETAGDSAGQVGWNHAGVIALIDSAEHYFDLAVAQDSSFIEPMVNLGSLWDDRAEQTGTRQERDHRLNKAKEFYELALAVDETDEKARCNLGSLYLRQRRTNEAMQEFQTVLAHNDRSALAHYNIAIMFAEQKIYREAITEWKLAAKYDPTGDIGERSRDNVEIVKDLLNAPELGQK